RFEVADLAANPEFRKRALDHEPRLLREHLNGHRALRRRARNAWHRHGERGHHRAGAVRARRLRQRKQLGLEELRLGRRPPRSALHFAALCSAARTVFLSSIAIVIGPTPPGTGVIFDARSRAPAKSTSPTRRKPL